MELKQGHWRCLLRTTDHIGLIVPHRCWCTADPTISRHTTCALVKSGRLIRLYARMGLSPYGIIAVKGAEGQETEAMASSQYRELQDGADFDSIVSSDGYLSICGFGSLLSERSARSTFPDLQNFRVAVLRGFRRVFAHTAPVFFERGIANMATKEISSLSVEPCPGEFIIVTVFEIFKSEVPAFIEREHEFRFLVVVPEDLSGKPFSRLSVICSRYSDEEYWHVRCKGSEEMFFQNYGRHNIDKIWCDDILPCRVYLRHCVLAAKNLGEVAYDNFVDHTFLGDRTTSIRQYLGSQGSSIMEEEPPDLLKERYGG